MSPRGVATPDVRERLFAAAERVVERDGPGALTSRAVTTEAGCAKGLLHTHFAGLDEFVAELCLDRFARTATKAGALTGLAGQGTVVRNLDAVVRALFDSGGPALSGLAMARPGAAVLIRGALEGGAPGFAAIQEAVTGYLEAEQELGRVAGSVDPGTAALAIVGTAHHLLMTSWPGTPDPRPAMTRLVAALVDGPDGPAGQRSRASRSST
ncbi:TetR/AcrR family transcriptional regulator [Streptomyces griseofuscus]|uniref:TetR/AcrR family transcriptional regulator n=1 Tax=Streptomyces TaxID=1883 RepID=UPI00081ECCE9|nr:MULTISPECIES: TetR/AcrR family transcriptional regulator [unclassified Streptomyces]SCF68247.1 transcriptional regulator, TetR family [Streptomyces sp. DconLS]SCF83262.1 transcriptional regulator, TetR family [Streptomyces sp. LamerLS-31b]